MTTAILVVLLVSYVVFHRLRDKYIVRPIAEFVINRRESLLAIRNVIRPISQFALVFVVIPAALLGTEAVIKDLASETGLSELTVMIVLVLLLVGAIPQKWLQPSRGSSDEARVDD